MSVQINHLTKVYGIQKAIDNISFEVKTGQVVGFLGPNGAGKSTTMKIISCFLPQTEGTVKVCGYDVTEQSIEVRRNVGYLPENNPLYLEMYVKEYLNFIGRLYGLKKNMDGRIDEMIEITGLTEEKRKKIGQLSKGYRQRVGLAQAILHNPPVLIMDEPTSGLDPNQIVEIRNLIKNLGKQKTVILSTHIMQEVQAVCDRIIIINKGKIVADDATQNLQQQVAGKTRLIIEFKDILSKPKLLEIPGVKDVEQLGGTKWRLHTGYDDVRAAVFEFAKNNNFTLLSLQIEESNLETVFQQLTTAGEKEKRI